MSTRQAPFRFPSDNGLSQYFDDLQPGLSGSQIGNGTFVLQPLDEVIPYTLYRQRPCPVGILAVPSRRMEDKIRKLCARAVAAGDGDFQQAISELQSALHEHAQELRKTLMEQLRGTRERRVRADSE